MTSKDYLRASKVVARIKNPIERDCVRGAFIRLFEEDNPRFSIDQFNAAVNKEIENNKKEEK